MTAFDVIVPAHLYAAAGQPPRAEAAPAPASKPEPRDPRTGQDPPKDFVWPAVDLPGIRVTN
jgi:hypothetical protein